MRPPLRYGRSTTPTVMWSTTTGVDCSRTSQGFSLSCATSSDEVLAEGHTIPCAWDGTVEGLGEGIDAMIADAFELRKRLQPTALGALAAEIRPQFQGQGLADTCARRDGRARPRRGAQPADRPGPSQLQGPIPDHPDRALRDLDSRQRGTVRSMDSRPRPPGRAGSPARFPTRCGSPGPSASGSNGPACNSPKTGNTHSPPGLLHWRSIVDEISGPTGSRTSGSSTRSANSPRRRATIAARPSFR